MKIKPEYYRELDEELKHKYKTFVGIDPDDISLKKFSQIEQIERYAKNYAFWLLEERNITGFKKVTGKELAKKFMVSQARNNILQLIENKFDNVMQKNIYRKANIYYNLYNFDKNFINEINLLRNRMELFCEEAERLYNLACSEPDVNDLPNPTIWLCNQTKMRKSWENMLESLNDAPKQSMLQSMLNNSFSNYMQYMYDTYPPCYSTELLKFKDSDFICDTAELYYILKNGINVDDICYKYDITDKKEQEQIIKPSAKTLRNRRKRQRRRQRQREKKLNNKEDNGRNNIEESSDFYVTLPPQNNSQKIVREQIKKLTSHIKEPHCIICGDTTEQSKLIKVTTINDGIQYLCDFCFECQKNM